MQPLISVIVPIYNVEKYVDECISSLIKQTYKNIEILLIDDGSTDGSGDICDRFKDTDRRIKVIHKPNSGVADTRNHGLSVMNGEYFCFVDGDDNVHENYISGMYDMLISYNADIAMCSYVYKWRNGDEKRTRNTEYDDNRVFTDTGADALKKMLYGKIYAPACWGKLFRADKIQVYFPNYATGEDVLACVDYLLDAEKIVMINKPLYFYMQNEESVMHSFNPVKLYDTVITADKIFEKCSVTLSSAVKAAAYYLIEKNLIVFMKLYGHDGAQDKIKHIKENIRRYRKTIITDKNAEMRTRIACLISYLGFGVLYKVRNATSK